jgi:Na+/H+-dicarboxylate symporter
MAGVPCGSLVAVAAVVPAFGIPAAGIAVLLVIDQLLDMSQTATNILGNAIATAVLGRRHDKAPRPGNQDHDMPAVLEEVELTAVR